MVSAMGKKEKVESDGKWVMLGVLFGEVRFKIGRSEMENSLKFLGSLHSSKDSK